MLTAYADAEGEDDDGASSIAGGLAAALLLLICGTVTVFKFRKPDDIGDGVSSEEPRQKGFERANPAYGDASAPTAVAGDHGGVLLNPLYGGLAPNGVHGDALLNPLYHELDPNGDHGDALRNGIYGGIPSGGDHGDDLLNPLYGEVVTRSAGDTSNGTHGPADAPTNNTDTAASRPRIEVDESVHESLPNLSPMAFFSENDINAMADGAARELFPREHASPVQPSVQVDYSDVQEPLIALMQALDKEMQPDNNHPSPSPQLPDPDFIQSADLGIEPLDASVDIQHDVILSRSPEETFGLMFAHRSSSGGIYVCGAASGSLAAKSAALAPVLAEPNDWVVTEVNAVGFGMQAKLDDLLSTVAAATTVLRVKLARAPSPAWQHRDADVVFGSQYMEHQQQPQADWLLGIGALYTKGGEEKAPATDASSERSQEKEMALDRSLHAVLEDLGSEMEIYIDPNPVPVPVPARVLIPDEEEEENNSGDDAEKEVAPPRTSVQTPHNAAPRISVHARITAAETPVTEKPQLRSVGPSDLPSAEEREFDYAFRRPSMAAVREQPDATAGVKVRKADTHVTKAAREARTSVLGTTLFVDPHH